MRPIKFRAWDKGSHNLELTDQVVKFWLSQGFDQSDNSRYVFMQFTGLLDKNGVEIYEGDVIQRVHHQVGHDYDDGKYIVEWEVFGFKCRPLAGGTSRLMLTKDSNKSDVVTTEVVGNIYENPELLHAPIDYSGGNRG